MLHRRQQPPPFVKGILDGLSRTQNHVGSFNSPSISTASATIDLTRSSLTFVLSNPYSKQAKSQCNPSEKNIPSTHANAIIRSANDSEPSIHRVAQFAFFCTQGIVLIARNKRRIIQINMDRPEANNALGKDMLRGLMSSFEAISTDPVMVHVWWPVMV
ncbi:hypothetical protein L1987_77363 [Smallanthus sonchifolius]|uniref:Uncharacterized protein n=1 Tax=Smallanthus sonchifolius TaxID=185202 RepID=A0ACB8ZAN2_9ASTR|nr:hypothetical protein L1987_77363 [Smallanthus sonchifolius]